MPITLQEIVVKLRAIVLRDKFTYGQALTISSC